MRSSRQRGGEILFFFQRANEMFSEGRGETNIPNEQMRTSRQGGGLKSFFQTSK